jgi:uncharacterized protein YceH (UPF0502 family)
LNQAELENASRLFMETGCRWNRSTGEEALRALVERLEPYVKEIPPSPGNRAERYVQLLYPELHDICYAAQPASSPG